MKARTKKMDELAKDAINLLEMNKNNDVEYVRTVYKILECAGYKDVADKFMATHAGKVREPREFQNIVKRLAFWMIEHPEAVDQIDRTDGHRELLKINEDAVKLLNGQVSAEVCDSCGEGPKKGPGGEINAYFYHHTCHEEIMSWLG